MQQVQLSVYQTNRTEEKVEKFLFFAQKTAQKPSRMKDLSYLCARICNHQIAETQVGNSQTSTFPRTADSEDAPPELEKRWCGPVESLPAASDAYIWPYTYYIYKVCAYYI